MRHHHGLAYAGSALPQEVEYPFFSDLDRGGTYQVRIFPFPVNINGLIVG